MATRNIPFPDKVRDMVLDVIKHVRRQEYTPEQLCQLQKIIECKYFYWWCMDMKKEEYVMELFTDDFTTTSMAISPSRTSSCRRATPNGATRTCRRCTWAISR